MSRILGPLSSGHKLELGQYGNGRLGVTAIAPDGIPECKVTVNLSDEPLGDDEFHVRFEDRHYSPRVFDALIDDGIAEPTGKVVAAGLVERYAEVWRLL